MLMSWRHATCSYTTMFIHGIILSVLIVITSGGSCAIRNLSYYVIPAPRNAELLVDYEGKVLYNNMTLKEYQKLGNFSECDYNGNKNFTNITIMFLIGVHEAQSDKAVRFNNVEWINFVGHGHSDQVIVKNLDLRIITGTVYIENITMQKTSIVMYRSSSPSTIYRPLTAVNCKFVASQMMLPNVQLTIEDSEFHNSSSTTITLYSSFAIFCAKVIFVNNSGVWVQVVCCGDWAAIHKYTSMHRQPETVKEY